MGGRAFSRATGRALSRATAMAGANQAGSPAAAMSAMANNIINEPLTMGGYDLGLIDGSLS
jgi:hypothetical protein